MVTSALDVAEVVLAVLANPVVVPVAVREVPDGIVDVASLDEVVSKDGVDGD